MSRSARWTVSISSRTPTACSTSVRSSASTAAPASRPVRFSAIFPEADVPGDLSFFTEINSQWYEDAAAARAKVAPLPGGDGAAAPAPAEGAPVAAGATAAAPTPAAAPAREAATAAAPAAPVAARQEPHEELGGYKYGENGVEGKCAVCGQYVVKGGVKFRQKSVLCPEDADKLARIADPYGKPAGRR